jgi:hypothetical protein
MASAIEIMLNSMGLGGAIEQAKQLAEAGALQRIVSFADALDAHTKAMNRLADYLERQEHERMGHKELSGSEENGDAEQSSAVLRLASGADSGGTGGPVTASTVSLAATGTD